MRRKGGEFEALEELRTFVGGPAAAYWAMAGEAPAPQLNDALSHSHSVAAAESDCHRRPQIDTTVDDGHDVPRDPI